MAFVDTLSKLVSRFMGKPVQDATEGSVAGYQRPVMPPFEEYDRLSIRQSRKDTIKDINKMIETDARVDRLIYKLSSDSAFGSFTVVVESSETDAIKERAQEIVDRTLSNINAKANVKGWSKGLIRDGDLFWQLVVDSKEKEIVRAKQLAAQITYSRLTATGNFSSDKKPYFQEDPHTFMVVKEFFGWEIVHLKWDGEDGKPYGKPMLKSSRLSWKRLDGGEKNIAIRRALRAGQKLHHKIGTEKNVGNVSDVEDYRKLNRDTIDNPQSPSQDYFSNGLVEITRIQGDETIGDLADLLYEEGKLNIVTGVPVALMGGGRENNVNRDIIQEQQEDYYKVVGDINETMESGLISILNFAFLLKEINPESIKLVFNWGIKDRQDRVAKAKLAKEYQEMGVSYETVYKTLDIDGVTYEEEIERIKKQIADGAIPYGINTKMDPTLAAILGIMQNSQVEEKVRALEFLARQILEGDQNGDKHFDNQRENLPFGSDSGGEILHQLLRGNGDRPAN